MGMNDKLNKKLAEWAGFKKSKYTTRLYDYPDKSKHYAELPNFPESLDACVKRLVPKLSHYFIGDSVDGHTATVWNQSYSYGAKGNTPALALCLAIEKLIDGEK